MYVRRREMERRQISIEMMNDHYDDMGVRIMMWLHLCYGPDRHPEVKADDMPGMEPVRQPGNFDREFTHTQMLHIRYFRQVDRFD